MAGTIEKRKRKKSVISDALAFLRSHKTELLVCIGALVAVCLLGYKLFDQFSTQLVVRDAASEFADLLREARAIAGERHAFVTVSAATATTWRGCTASLKQGNADLTSLDLPAGVSTEGTVTFSPYGLPSQARNFIVRKGNATLTIVINEHGLITIPAP